jgi:hypothetical protein
MSSFLARPPVRRTAGFDTNSPASSASRRTSSLCRIVHRRRNGRTPAADRERQLWRDDQRAHRPAARPRWSYQRASVGSGAAISLTVANQTSVVRQTKHRSFAECAAAFCCSPDGPTSASSPPRKKRGNCGGSVAAAGRRILFVWHHFKTVEWVDRQRGISSQSHREDSGKAPTATTESTSDLMPLHPPQPA